MRGHLGVGLLCHAAHGMALARRNHIFCRRYHDMLSNLSTTRRTIDGLRSGPRNEVGLATPIACNRRRLLPLIGSFVIRCDSVRIATFLDGRGVSLISNNCSLTVHVNGLDSSAVVTGGLDHHAGFIYTTPTCLRGCNAPRTLSRLDRRGYLLNAHSC